MLLRMLALATIWLGACGGGASVPAAEAPPPVVAETPPPVVAETPPAVRLGALPDDAVVMGCSCTFAADGTTVLSGEVDESLYYAVIDGVRRTFRAEGDHTWRDGDLTLRMVETASRPCPPEMRECEAVGSTRTVALSRGEAVLSTQVVDGACGC